MTGALHVLVPSHTALCWVPVVVQVKVTTLPTSLSPLQSEVTPAGATGGSSEQTWINVLEKQAKEEGKKTNGHFQGDCYFPISLKTIKNDPIRAKMQKWNGNFHSFFFYFDGFPK